MTEKEQVLEFVNSIQQLYLEQRDVDNVLKAIDQHTSWIGTGSHEVCKSFSEASQALLLEKEECKNGFIVTDSWYEAEMIAPTIWVVYGEFQAKQKANGSQCEDDFEEVAELNYRVSAVCSKTDNQMKLLHVHVSVPDDDLENGEDYVKKRTKADNNTLRQMVSQTAKELHDRSQALEILTKNIPGGVYQCANDSPCTLLSMSGGFLSMFGYTREEIATDFDNSFMNMIYESDRAGVAKVLGKHISCDMTVEFEYRVRCKNGDLIWILDRDRLVRGDDGEETFFCIMMDITKRKEEQEKLRLSLERHQIIMDQTTDIIFEWDIQKDTIGFSGNWKKKFGYLPIRKDISKKIPNSANLYPEDVKLVVQIMQDVSQGVPYAETECRICNQKSEYTWCRIRATTQFDNDGSPIKAVGVIIDINDEKTKSNKLVEQAQIDSLTKLYNKNTVKIKVQKMIEDQNDTMHHALMIIDVDNFKNINDQFGHLCGDAVLSNMAHTLKKLFRVADVVGRIGGDEFLVFMGNITDKDFVLEKAKNIVDIFKQMPLDIRTDISCSVGVALYPEDAKNYMDLYACADRALYQVKNEGKKGAAFYREEMGNNKLVAIPRTAVNETIDSEGKYGLGEEWVQYTFNMLYHSADTEIAINQILAMVGQTYEVSRVYVFESSENNLYCINTFEWCNEGITPEKEQLQSLYYDTDLDGFLELYDENGVFYCADVTVLQPHLRDILVKQGIVSVLQCLIGDDGIMGGYVGFDECHVNRYWIKEQINSLILIANVLSTFLLKHRQKQRIAKLEEKLRK